MKQVLNFLMIILGNTLYALAVVLFILPNGLVTGGSTGIGLFLQGTWGIPVSAFVSVFNVLMFLLGFWILGKKVCINNFI